MTTPNEYREHALECLKWAEETPSKRQRKTFIDIARLWMATASRIDHGDGADPAITEIIDTLRAKLI
jgi:hypothetical protein